MSSKLGIFDNDGPFFAMIVHQQLVVCFLAGHSSVLFSKQETSLACWEEKKSFAYFVVVS